MQSDIQGDATSIDAIDTRPTLLIEQAPPARIESSATDRNRPGTGVPLMGSGQEATVKEARARTTARLQATATALVTYQSPKPLPNGRSRNLNPLDRVRWWLLYPGRIEFMLWLCGTVLLIGVTCLFLLVTAFSFNWIAPGQQSGMVPQNVTNTVSTANPVLTLLDHGPFSPGQVVHLHGQGFSINGRIIFTFDSAQLRPDQYVASEASSQPQVIAGGHGEFTISLTLGDGQTWKAGRHLIVAHDITTNRLATLPIFIVANRATPVPTTNSGNQAGPTGPALPTPGITITPPARSTPPPARPTATATPKPTPKPTPAPTVVPTATVTITPAVSPTATKATSTTSLIADPGPSSLSENLAGVQDQCRLAFHRCPVMTLAGHTWLLALAYVLALIMLIIAGVIRSACRQI